MGPTVEPRRSLGTGPRRWSLKEPRRECVGDLERPDFKELSLSIGLAEGRSASGETRVGGFG